MTITAPDPVRTEPAAAPEPPPPPPGPPPGAPRPENRRVAIGVAVAVGTLAVLVVGFFGYLIGFSGLSEARAQHALRQTLQRQLAAATAPVGPTNGRPIPIGHPVAVLDIPQIGLRDAIVVEGTSSRNLMNGPGHLPSTPLPGQPGISTVFGKRATFGAPFANLLTLKVGDAIQVTTGQGKFRYVVSSFGDTKHPPPANSANRLLLATADDGLDAGGLVVVSADLRSAVAPSAGVVPAPVAQDKELARDFADSLVPLTAWSQALLLVAILATFLLTRTEVRWPALLCLLPVALAVLWSVFENAAGLLPNVL